jgi:glycosyltransferase involved in cell wall biosynthesis
MYTGTLGLKHDPMLLADAAAALGNAARVVVISEGLGRAVLEEARSTRHLANLELLDFQPYESLPEVMASADVLVAILEPEASVYSVPSKVLTYLCSGRPIVGVIPSDNSVARVIREADAGRLVPPGDSDGLATTLKSLLSDDALRSRLGEQARRYAEKTFDADAVASHFEEVLRTALR